MDERFYVRKLQEILGMSETEAERLVKGYLTMMWNRGFNIPGTNGYLGGLTFFGGVFYQIETGGHDILTPEGQPTKMVIVAAEDGVYKNSDGRDAWKIYMLCPKLRMGPLVVAYRDCETYNLEILFGLSPDESNSSVSGSLMALIESEAKREKKGVVAN
jgi:hypothetical protein